MNLGLRLSACFVAVLAVASLWNGCTGRQRALEGARIYPDVERPEDMLRGIGFGGKEKPPYVYFGSNEPHSKMIDGVLYHGWTLYESPIPRGEAMRRGWPPEEEIEAVKNDPARRLVEIYAHRAEQPPAVVDIRVSCRMPFVLAWDEKVALKDIEAGKVVEPDRAMEGFPVDPETAKASGIRGSEVIWLLTLAPGEYHLQATEN